MEDTGMRVTQHSGVGMGSVIHNTRDAITRAIAKGNQLEDKHIDINRISKNMFLAINEDAGRYEPCSDGKKVAEIERAFYERHYKEALDRTNQKYLANYHPERCKTIDDILRDRKENGQPNKTAPEELIVQIGDKDDHPDPELFNQCLKDYLNELLAYNREHGNHMHILDVSIHHDEATPHAHIRRVFDYVDEQGLTHIGQAKGLEQMGLELPDPSAPRSRHNNYKMTFDKEMRQKWIDICKNHGLEIEEQVKEPGRKHIQDKDQYIAHKQERQDALISRQNALIRKETELVDKSVAELTRDAHMGVYEGIERGLDLPTGSLTKAIQKSIDNTNRFESQRKEFGITFKQSMIDNLDELLRDLNNPRYRQNQRDYKPSPFDER